MVREYQIKEDTATVSRLKSWTNCRYRHDLEYVRRIRRRRTGGVIDLGSAVHEGLAAALLSSIRKDARKVFTYADVIERAIDHWHTFIVSKMSTDELDDREAMAELNDTSEKAKAIAKRAIVPLLSHYEVVVLDDGTPLVEYALNVRVAWKRWKVRNVHGTVDLVARDKQTGSLWVIDHKTREQLQAEQWVDFDLQLAMYQWMLQKSGIPVVGSIQYQIRSAVPREPNVNKNGSMSRAAIATTWDIYRAALIREGLDPDEYGDMKEKLEAQKWHEFSKTYRSAETLEFIVEDQARANCRDMFTKGHMRRVWRALGSISCRSCRMIDFCRAELHGDDIAPLLDTLFYVWSPDEKEPPEPPLPAQLELKEV